MSKEEAVEERKRAGAQLWSWLIRGLLGAIFVGVVVPRILHDIQEAKSGDRAKQRQAREKAEGADPKAASVAEASAWRPLSGSGGGGFSAGDVMACNQAAQAARRYPSQKLPSHLASAMSGGKGTLVGATAESLRQVNVRARDDARAASVYEACIFERSR